MKYLTIILISISFLNASYLFDKDTPVCIEDYYYKNGRVYFQSSDTMKYSSTSENNIAGFIHSGYEYDSDNDMCVPLGLNEFGLTVEQFNFLLALIGLIFGAVFMFFTIQAFTSVGGKK